MNFTRQKIIRGILYFSAEDDALLCLNTEKTRLSPQCTTSSKTATIGQSEEEMEELSKDKDIQHINIRGEELFNLLLNDFFL